MIFFYLFAFIYASNAIHPVSKDDIMNPDNIVTGNSTGAKELPSNLLASIKSNPQLFVESMQNLDPAALQRVITLLEDLKTSSEAEETQLIDDLSAKNTALDQANARVVQKENDLDDANDAVDDANAAVTAAQGVLTTTQQAATAAGTALTNEREDQAGKQAEKDASQTAHDNQIPPLNEEQRVLTEVIAMLRGLPDASPSNGGWQLVASVASNDETGTAFWNTICGNFDDLTVADTILVEMGQVKDYFHPGGSMSLCHFLLNEDYSWSPTEDGGYVRPQMDGRNMLGGSKSRWVESIDGREYLPFWGRENRGDGGCCHYTSTNYGGAADVASWGRAFSLSVKYA